MPPLETFGQSYIRPEAIRRVAVSRARRRAAAARTRRRR